MEMKNIILHLTTNDADNITHCIDETIELLKLPKSDHSEEIKTLTELAEKIRKQWHDQIKEQQ
jgi:hypothetical protein